MLWALSFPAGKSRQFVQSHAQSDPMCTRQALLCAFGVSLYSEGVKFTGSYREMPLQLLPQLQRVVYPVGPHTRKWHWKAAQRSVCACARTRQWHTHTHVSTLMKPCSLITGWSFYNHTLPLISIHLNQ